MAGAAAAPRSPWLHGPASDLLLGAGLVYVPVFLALAVAGEPIRAALPATLMPLLMVCFNAPHLGATLLRVYERREDRQRYALFAVHAGVAIAVAFAVGLYVPLVGSLLITFYLSVVPWHFTGQNYGIALIFLRRRGVEVDAGLKRALYASFALSYAMTLLGLHGEGVATVTPVDPSGTVYRFLSIGIPGRLHLYVLVVLGLAYLAALLETAARLRGRARAADALPAAAVVVTQAIWFSIPILIHVFVPAERMGPLAPARYAYTALWVSLGHAVQYLWITTYYAERQAPRTTKARFLGKALLAGSAIYGLPALLLAPGLLGRVPYQSGLLVMLAGALNLHHVLLDGAIWKLRSGPIARILIRGDPEAGAVGSAAPPAGWLGPLVWASGILGAFLTIAGTLEWEFGFRRAHDRGDLPRLEAAARRLDWLGRGDPTLLAAIGTLRAERGDRAGALDSLRRSVALHPTAAAWVDIGVVHERGGDLAEALAAYEVALGLSPDFVPALHYAGRVHLRDGRAARARALLERAAHLAPHDPAIRETLRRAEAQEGGRS